MHAYVCEHVNIRLMQGWLYFKDNVKNRGHHFPTNENGKLFRQSTTAAAAAVVIPYKTRCSLLVYRQRNAGVFYACVCFCVWCILYAVMRLWESTLIPEDNKRL